MVAKEIWSVQDDISKKRFFVTRYSENILLDPETEQILIVIDCDRKPDYNLEGRKVKIVIIITHVALDRIQDLFEGRGIKYRKVERGNYGKKEKTI